MLKIPVHETERLVGEMVSAGATLRAADGKSASWQGSLGGRSDSDPEQEEAILQLFADSRARGVVALGPTTHEQQRMERRSRSDRNDSTVNACVWLDLKGPVDQLALQRAAVALVRRHDALRTRYSWYGEHLVQEVMAPPRAVVQMLSPSVLGDATEDEVKRWCAGRSAMAFDLAAESPVRWSYAPRSREHALLLITMHHIVADGWAWRIVLDELGALYRAEMAGGEDADPLPPLRATPTDFARGELNQVTSERIDWIRGIWAKELDGATLRPWLGRARAARSGELSARPVLRHLPANLAANMTALARAACVTEFAAYLATFGIVLCHETGGPDPVVVIPVANRPQPEHWGLVACCRNSVPIRCSARREDTLLEVAQRMGERVWEAMDRQSFSIELFVSESVWPHRDRPPSVTTFQHLSGDSRADLRAGSWGPVIATPHDVFPATSRAEFSLFTMPRGSGIEALLEYAPDRLSHQEAMEIADRWVKVVQCAANPTTHVGDLPGFSVAAISDDGR